MISDQPRFRRHDGACPFYRENWLTADQRRNRKGELSLYEIYCLREMPPETVDEQVNCMASPEACWRDKIPHRRVLRQQQVQDKAANKEAS